MNWLLALVLVALFRAFAFKATHPAAFIVDIILVIFLAAVLKSCGL